MRCANHKNVGVLIFLCHFIEWLKAQGDFICGTAQEVVLRRVQMDMKDCTSDW